MPMLSLRRRAFENGTEGEDTLPGGGGKEG